jgi:hypothetical protein
MAQSAQKNELKKDLDIRLLAKNIEAKMRKKKTF